MQKIETEKDEVMKKLRQNLGVLKGQARCSDEEAGERAFIKVAKKHGLKLD